MSVRRSQPRPIPELAIQDMLGAARRSPSRGNEQTRVFGVITDCDLIQQIPKLANGQKWIASVPHFVPSERLAIGYPEFEQEPRVKKSLDEIVFRNVFKG